MSESFVVLRFPIKKAIFRALLAPCDNLIERIVVFKVCRAGVPNTRINLCITINRIKRFVVNGCGTDVWQFTGMLRLSDTYDLEGIDRILGDAPRRYVGGELSIRRNRITWSPHTKNLVVLTEEEFTLFQR
ncbi:MAG: hypothetical protein G01um101448_300 [Parcubacteria group bacterium Gr01-1014_48]|nr:MAG: hypothetical protein Greene041614_311 [Parcubacteria group bacterium Greene0416_14]TSC74137.1 MAG: hypothetical protein G01um101448_300 [Parcubacteria group bacterium Gr01-1014_48]TSD01706.1 MAG: hypothetical protein Greene101415_104 [Parcubacteria group bacterium Greene1014_15]TSD08160.1 MAG: hypothetical protein Greene07144_342 [Parcubacteria group bacterium Greene0714_4]